MISCIQNYTEYCSLYQKYAVETIFVNLAMKLGVQRSCSENKIGNIDVSYFMGYVGCVNGFTRNITEILDVRSGKDFLFC